MMCNKKEAKQFKNATMMLNVTQNKTTNKIIENMESFVKFIFVFFILKLTKF